MASERVTIKGTSKGVVITIGAGNWETVLRQLGEMLEKKATFFKGGRVSITVGERLLGEGEIEALGNLITLHQMTLWAINGSAKETQDAAQALGLELNVDLVSERKPKSARPRAKLNETEEVITFRGTLRSGRSIESLGNVVVIGDVNPGAEVKAGGYVIIWGKLRGTVYAGAISPDNAFVCALELSPMHLIIGSAIARSPANNTKSKEVIPEIAFVQDGQIVAEAWS